MNIQGLHSLPKLMATENLGSKILEQKSFILNKVSFHLLCSIFNTERNSKDLAWL